MRVVKYHFKSGEPCNHIGCKNHISHPCEYCGRIGAIGDVEFVDWVLADYISLIENTPKDDTYEIKDYGN